MIRRITIGILDLIFIFLPPHKRLAKRLAWLRGLLYPFKENEDLFYPWRDEMIIRAKVTGQKMSLQWYLNHLFDPVLQRIIIDDSQPGGTAVSLESEGTASVVVGLESLGETGVAFFLEGESSSSLPYDFRVYSPAFANDVNLIKGIVDLYNMAHKSYDIIIF